MTPSMHHRRLAAVLVGAALGLAMTAGPASARVVLNNTYEFAYGPEVSFCGEPFIQQGVERGRERIVARGGQEYFHGTARFSDTWTNSLTGEWVSVEGLYNGRDHEIIENSDGTTTYIVWFAGTSVMRDSDGAVLGRTAGRNGVALTFDNAGQFVSRVVLDGSGQTFEFCNTLERAIG
jgi:hypothetical protein